DPRRSRSSSDAREQLIDLALADRSLAKDLHLIGRAVDDRRGDAAWRRAPVEHEGDPAIELRHDLLRRPCVALARSVRARDRKATPARGDEPPRERMVGNTECQR